MVAQKYMKVAWWDCFIMLGIFSTCMSTIVSGTRTNTSNETNNSVTFEQWGSDILKENFDDTAFGHVAILL